MELEKGKQWRKGQSEGSREGRWKLSLYPSRLLSPTCTQLSRPFRRTYPASSRLLSSGFAFTLCAGCAWTLYISSRIVCHENPKFRFNTAASSHPLARESVEPPSTRLTNPSRTLHHPLCRPGQIFIDGCTLFLGIFLRQISGVDRGF